MIDFVDYGYAARKLSTSLHRDLKVSRLMRIDIESVRCAVAGYFIGAEYTPTEQQVADLENLTLRKIVEACS